MNIVILIGFFKIPVVVFHRWVEQPESGVWLVLQSRVLVYKVRGVRVFVNIVVENRLRTSE